ncbi:MAG TPA: NAD(P)/FAD-dependent oxidoreductase [Candidatus Limnocylindrales bacterium]|nr:NAD(P)/FAD-dependent oxidoreductase [Candidatus Limnocylindrales bacterium]
MIVVGGGHNGLVAAGYLSRAGLRTLVLERRERLGGAADTVELEPGVRVPAVAHTVGRLRPAIVRDLRLSDWRLSLVQPEVRVFAPQPDGAAITLWGDPLRTAAELRAGSPSDADAYLALDRQIRVLSGFLARLLSLTPPDLRSPSLGDALGGLRLGLGFRGLARSDARLLLRALPMPVADYVGGSFRDPAIAAAIAARGIQYTGMGPRAPGTTAVLLTDSAGTEAGAAGQAVFARGGPGALAEALANAVRGAGGEIRTGARVEWITSRDGRATGVALESGEEIGARAVVSGADPKRTLLDLVEPSVLGPSLAWRVGNLRAEGAIAKVNLCLSGLPRFSGDTLEDGERRIRGRIVVAPGIDALERAADDAKYGRLSEVPYLEATIPSLLDPGLVPEGRHVLSVIVQYAPYRLADGGWDARREQLGDRVIATLERYAPGIGGLVTARQILTPLDLERDYGMTGGHPYHLEPGLDQMFAWRPLLGFAAYRMPLERLYLCGAGAHPGGGITGAPGANAAREVIHDLRGRR